MFVAQEVPLARIVVSGIAAFASGLAVSVLGDTWMWRARYPTSQYMPVWPEWEGFYFNSILGMSSEWGTSPFYQYGLDLMKLLLNPIHLVLIPFALRRPALKPRLLALVIPPMTFVSIMSQLPHKEWRFIIYVVPALTTVSAVGAAWMSNRWSRGLVYRLFTLTIIASVVVSGFVSFTALGLSSLNYPGGEAMIRFFDLTAQEERPLNIWLDNLSCQTGVTRFLENRRIMTTTKGEEAIRQYNFDKSDNETERMYPEWWQQFDYVVVEHNERAIGLWPVVDVINALDGINVVRPQEKSLDPTLTEPEKALMKLASSSSTAQHLVDGWNNMGTIGRSVTRGWWINIRMRPRLKILKNESRLSATA
jgi:alpha-1,6-mannosyltransferase